MVLGVYSMTAGFAFIVVGIADLVLLFPEGGWATGPLIIAGGVKLFDVGLSVTNQGIERLQRAKGE
jgi:hypothetical protein